MKIYTDGSCKNNQEDVNNGACGALFVSDDNEIIDKIIFKSENTTNNRMELLAIILGIEYALEKLAISDEELFIFTDSAYIYNCYKNQWFKKWLQNGWKTSKKESVKNQDLWEKLIKYFINPKCHFYKVKGHDKDIYNNMIDSLVQNSAKKG